MTPLKIRFVREFEFREFVVKVARSADGKYHCAAYKGQTARAEASEDVSQEQAERKIREQLLLASATYVGPDGARSILLRHFPGGFGDPTYISKEREYKVQASEFVTASLSESAFRSKNDDVLSKAIRDAATKTNLLSQFELIRIGNAIKTSKGKSSVVGAIRSVMYAADFDKALAGAVATLRPFELAKWPVLTYFPYLRFPERHMFLKPEVTRDCADRMGIDLEYDSTPNTATYRQLLALTEALRTALRPLRPRDNIDIQSAIWVLGDEEYRSRLASLK